MVLFLLFLFLLWLLFSPPFFPSLFFPFSFFLLHVFEFWCSEIIHEGIYSHIRHFPLHFHYQFIINFYFIGRFPDFVSHFFTIHFSFLFTTFISYSLHFIMQVLEMLSGCGSGMSSYLPTHEHIAFLMDLMEVALNVHGLIELCIQVQYWGSISPFSSLFMYIWRAQILIHVEGVLNFDDEVRIGMRMSRRSEIGFEYSICCLLLSYYWWWQLWIRMRNKVKTGILPQKWYKISNTVVMVAKN